MRLDVSGDGLINSVDIALLRRYLLGNAELSDLQKSAVMRDAYSEPDLSDLVRMKKFITA